MVADEMDMVVVVVAGGAVVFAEGIENVVVGGGYGVDNAFFHKGLQGTIDGYTVKFFSGFFFYIAVGKGFVLLLKQFQYFFAAIGNAQLITFQNSIHR